MPFKMHLLNSVIFRRFQILGLLFACSFLLGCGPVEVQDGGKEQGKVTLAANSPQYDFKYHLDRPDKKHKLSSELVEISGLAWMEEEILAAVQDEKGNVYLFDFGEGEVIKKIDFAGSGDYEGIAKRKEEIWVLRSDGRLYQLVSGEKVRKFDTPLDEDFDVEGLDYYPKKDVLLLACKGYPGQGEVLKNKKTVYAFHPKSEKLDMEPIFIIDPAEIKPGKVMRSDEKVEEFINPGKGGKTFQPSGIAVHPKTGDIYVISSVGKKLLILSPKGKLLHVESLDYKYFDQPEGICFAPDARMYISSEGAGGKGKIMRFDPEP